MSCFYSESLQLIERVSVCQLTVVTENYRTSHKWISRLCGPRHVYFSFILLEEREFYKEKILGVLKSSCVLPPCIEKYLSPPSFVFPFTLFTTTSLVRIPKSSIVLPILSFPWRVCPSRIRFRKFQSLTPILWLSATPPKL